ncbi:MAG: ATP-binding protein [Bacteroidales bacterium]|nr:ATP-binding protein [Bacteroidales bacterium]MDY0314864.1 [Fe-Fe] hydrogenase large subunit C-terminal domain-containing protein [Bacteroidales bacterium]
MIRFDEKTPLVFTITDRCKTCYTCIRECPAKAISMQNGQANVIPERCIGCGNCVKVCTRKAKDFYNEEIEVLDLIESGEDCIACIAPAFPAEFKEIQDYGLIVGMLKKLGFKKVVEVSFGADLVAEKYREIFLKNEDKKYISSDCPAIVSYITKYHPHLSQSLAPVVSPLMAIVKVIKEMYGSEQKVVFIGPCIAKKNESGDPDFVLTFKEIRNIFKAKGIKHTEVKSLDFDPPISGRGSIFPVSRGIINTINIQENLIQGNIIVADGRQNFKEAIIEFENGLINDHHLELLCCEGCIMGPGMHTDGRPYENRAYVTRYVNKKLKELNWAEWKENMNRFSKLDLSRSFVEDDQRVKIPSQKEIEEIYIGMDKINKEDRLDCHACGYESCEEHAIAVIRGLAEIDMCLPYNLEKLNKMVNELNLKNTKLETVQQALKQSEKLAHLGQLSAGIAHEINNPLGIVIMYANILLDETNSDTEIYNDLKLICEQANRCKNIVGGLLNFARKNKIRYETLNILDFIEACKNSVIIPANIKYIVKNKLSNPIIAIDESQMMQAISNIMKNAIESMPGGGSLSIDLENEDSELVIKISDSGAGISEEHIDKIFTPFFTTKGIGHGTGLGLPTTYGIIKMHKGKINLTTNTDISKAPTGTSFIIKLPQVKFNEYD